MSPTDEEERNRSQRAFNLTMAAVAGQVGCLTLAIIFAALFLGLWLDSRFDSRPWITIVLMIGSVPVTLFLMFWVVRKATARLTSGSNQKAKPFEEGEDG
jgi:F0F1-type ATP synthase assembly protein I